jgi:integral membrane sensor domain MASE1
VLKHLLEHPFFFRHQIQRIIRASATAIWPPTGIALTAFLLFGYEVWPGVLVGAFLVNVTTAGSVPVCLAIAVGNTLEGLAGAYLVNKRASGSKSSHQGLSQLRDFRRNLQHND